ncbi:MAG: MerR family transcriptional regulator [Chloroflexota bacterium]|nr:MerR family transcriptional regulator [Chloroflexota bacterium]
MVSISEYPPEGKYTIKIVSERTGVQPVTLRAWERRYGFLEPERLENNYRLYSDRDIQVVRWITHRLAEGNLTISNAVREYKGLRAQGIWPEALPTVLAPSPTKQPVFPAEKYAEMLYEALTAHDEQKARQIFDVVQSMFDLNTIFFEIFQPCLYKIGDAWYRGEIRIATEHFASAFIEGILMKLLQAFPIYSTAPSLLIGCAPEEFHEIAPLMLSVLLRREGYQVEFLGADLPVEDLVFYAGDTSADMVILSAGFERTAAPLGKLQALLDDLPSQPKLGFGGRYFNENEAARREMGGVFLGATLEEAIQNVHDLMD